MTVMSTHSKYGERKLSLRETLRVQQGDMRTHIELLLFKVFRIRFDVLKESMSFLL